MASICSGLYWSPKVGMPSRSIPSVSGVVPSIHRWTQSSGYSAARSWRLSLTGPSSIPSRLGKLAWPARSGP